MIYMYRDDVHIHPQGWVGVERPRESAFEPIEDREQTMAKPYGGLWTSTVTESGTTAWIEWCSRENFLRDEDARFWVLEPATDLDVVVVDSVSDLKTLVDDYPNYPDPPVPVSVAPVSFEALAEDFDCMWLTEKGQRETHLSDVNLYGWDCECVLWFDWQFESVVDCGPVTDVM